MLKVAMIQTNPLIADFDGNAEKILRFYREAVKQGAELAVAPELALWGYPPKDLLLERELHRKHEQALDRLRQHIGEVPLILGATMRHPNFGTGVYNTAVAIHRHRIVAVQKKTFLPTYDVFDEKRYFDPNPLAELAFFSYKNKRIAMLVCEDLWRDDPELSGRYGTDLIAKLADHHFDLLVTVNASPFHKGKHKKREALVSAIARRVGAPVVYVNQVGGQDELVFDGASFAVDAEGRLLFQAPAFEEGVFLDAHANYPEGMEELKQALVLGIADYFGKQNFSKAVLGLSGGIDSAVVASLAKEALGAEAVSAYSLPSAFSSQGTQEDAEVLGKRLGIGFARMPIGSLYREVGKTLAPHIGWEPEGVVRLVEENVQARLRGLLLMAVSNETGALVLATGNKSELSVGYCTLYGDMVGGFAPIADVWKTEVFALARHINKDGEIIPNRIIARPPSAELAPGQKDADALPPYEVLDPILKRFIEHGKSAEEIVAEGFPPEEVFWATRQVAVQEYKRRQAPLGIRVSPKAFGFGRRFPVVYRK